MPSAAERELGDGLVVGEARPAGADQDVAQRPRRASRRQPSSVVTSAPRATSAVAPSAHGEALAMLPPMVRDVADLRGADLRGGELEAEGVLAHQRVRLQLA